MKIKMWVMGLVIFAVIFGGIGVTMAIGDWTTTSDKTPGKYESGEYAGESNPEDIRGSYSFSDVSEAFGIELGVLYEAFGIPDGTDGTAIKTKDIEAQYGEAEIGNESVQVFVALYKGLPITLTDVYLPKSAVEIILDENTNMTQDQKDYLAEHQIDIGEGETVGITEPEQTIEPSGSEEDEPAINGSSTFQQAIDAGLTRVQIEEIIGGSMPATNMKIRDYCTQNGLSFSEIKTTMNNALEQG